MQYGRRLFDSGSRFFNVALATALAGATLAVSTTAGAQAFPFPSTTATTAFTTPVLTSHELRAQYNTWRTRFVQRCDAQGDARLRYPESGDDTRSEGVGYGMVIAAYFGDQATFDGLWNYYQRSSPGTGLMHWRRDGCNAGGGDTGSASDADIDAAFGLVVANKQWPGEGYAADAGRVVAAIRTQLFQGGCAGILLAGTQFANCGCINPSYIPPGYYPAFGASDAGQAGFWTTARNNSYTYFTAVNDNNTGLVPAWSASNGSLQLAGGCTPQVSGGGQPNEFQADAARTPWRVATDYLFSGNAQARTFLSSIAAFANTQRIVHIVDRYNLGGTPLNGVGQGQNLDATGFRSTFTMGGFATAMMASSQVDVDEFTGAWQSMYVPGDNIGPNGPAPRAFNSSLALLYGLAVTGYMWNPTGANPTRVTEPALAAQGTNQLENGDFDEGFLNWTMENIGGVASEGFAMHKGGELHLLNQRVSGVAGNQWHLRLSQTVSVQAGQRYRLSVRARADQPRLLRMIVAQVAAPFATYLAIDDDPETEGSAFNVGTDMETHEVVVQAAATDAQARFAFELADSVAGLTIDDVVFEPTDLPLTVPGATTTDPVTPPGTTPPGTTPPGTTPPGSTPPGTTPPGGGNIGTVTPGGEPTGSGLTPVGAPNPNGSTGGSPPAPAGRPNGAGTCSVVNDPACGMFKCSTVLGLCYEDTYGYVWDSAADMGAGRWSQPPYNVAGCGPQFVFWPKVNGCYDPVTGYAFNPATKAWEYVGDQYTAGQDDEGGAADSGCAVSGGPASRDSSEWLLVGLLGAAFGLSLRRRVA